MSFSQESPASRPSASAMVTAAAVANFTCGALLLLWNILAALIVQDYSTLPIALVYCAAACGIPLNRRCAPEFR